MKKINLLIWGMLNLINLSAQTQTPEFQFTLYAEDYFGNIDSVVIGYDSTATEYDGWDTQFGEVDITNTPFDSVFELRASVNNSLSGYPNKHYQTKKEIAKWQCYNKHPFLDGLLHLSVRTVNLPVRFSWDKSLFQDTCNKWIAMAESNNWEIGGFNGYVSHALFKNNGYYVAFNNGSTAADDVITYTAAIEDGSTDTIYGLTLYFWSKNRLFSATNRVFSEIKANVYPNPVTLQLHIETPDNFKAIQRLYIFGTDGKLIHEESINVNEWTTEVSHLPDGLYFYMIQNKEGEMIRGKFIKKE